MTRAALTNKILDAKRRLGLTWKVIAEALGEGSLVFYTAALLGHQALTQDEARKACTLLALDEAAAQTARRTAGGTRGDVEDAAD